MIRFGAIMAAQVGKAALGLLAAAAAGPALAEGAAITIGTGSITGVYYPAGRAICRMVNRDKALAIRCTVESTDGSVANIQRLREASLDLGIVQSDVQFNAVKGLGKDFAGRPFADLRALFALHAEAFTLLARADAGIESFDSLKGKRVDLGREGSGQRATLGQLLDLAGWGERPFGQTAALKGSEISQQLCGNRIDASIYVVGHPNGAIQEATATCHARLVPMAGPLVDRLLAEYAYYAPTVIPGGLYVNNAKPVATFGVAATLVASVRLAEPLAYELVKAVFENFDQFRALHPAFEHLDRSRLPRDGLTAPLHDGALRYFKETGLL